MDDVTIGLITILFVLVTVYIGIHVGVALSLISFVGVWLIQGDVVIAGKLLALAAAESLQRYEFGVIPLFILMGLFVSVSDIGRDTYDVANHIFRKLKGGLGTATVAAVALGDLLGRVGVQRPDRTTAAGAVDEADDRKA